MIITLVLSVFGINTWAQSLLKALAVNCLPLAVMSDTLRTGPSIRIQRAQIKCDYQWRGSHIVKLVLNHKCFYRHEVKKKQLHLNMWEHTLSNSADGFLTLKPKQTPSGQNLSHRLQNEKWGALPDVKWNLVPRFGSCHREGQVPSELQPCFQKH